LAAKAGKLLLDCRALACPEFIEGLPMNSPVIAKVAVIARSVSDVAIHDFWTSWIAAAFGLAMTAI
jgi:hypothetical protein